MAFKIPTNTPGPSPWYLREGDEVLPGLRWQAAGSGTLTSGKTVLTGPRGAVAILDFYNYVLPLPDGRLLVWHQRRTSSGPTEPVLLQVLHPESLSPLAGDTESLCGVMKERDLPILLDGHPESQLALPTIAQHSDGVAFPACLSHLDELLIACHSSYAEPSPSWERGDVALMIAAPSKGSLSIFPQDWFNRGDMDFGYLWITRFARDPSTGNVHGDGVRISPFVLAPGLRARYPANAA